MNIYDISQTRDPTKTYSKTFEEAKCANWMDFNEKVTVQRKKLERAIFAHKGNFYFAKFAVIDQSEKIEGATINRKMKFVWKYQYIK